MSQISHNSLALTLALCVVPASAGEDFGMLHITNANVEINGKSTLQLHSARFEDRQDAEMI